MLKPNVQDALNTQLNAEVASSYLYLSMAAHLESQNFRGMAHWMQTQAREEWKHAMKFFGHIIERGGHVTLKQIDAPKGEWKSVLDVFQDTLKHEQCVTAGIHGIVKLSTAESDYATQNFLQWFVNEQVEEESSAQTIVSRLQMMGDGNVGLFILDGELGRRAGE
jgi:ferritin